MPTTDLTTKTDVIKTTEKAQLFVEGLTLLETMDTMPEEMKLTAYVFDPVGKLLGSAPLDAKGRFNVPVHLDHPADVQLVVGPAGEPEVIRASSVYKQTFHAKDWAAEGARYLLKPRVFVPKDFLTWWRRIPISITGHVRTTSGKPIPYLKVEIFDVDREGFFWPYLMNKTLPPNLKVLDIAELLEKGPIPHASPNPERMERLEATAPAAGTAAALPEAVSLKPQPEPPVSDMLATQTGSRVGEMATAAPALAAKLENLTLTSRFPIWNYFRFYSKQLVATVHTDLYGRFGAFFNWRPFYLRRGRLRFDTRPDIIVRVIQTIDGVEKVLYMDPYTSTRWNVSKTHIDLWLDDAEFMTGSGVSQEAPPATQTFFTRVGNDDVFHIDQQTGLYNIDQTTETYAAQFTNVAYGHVLRLHGVFGKSLSSGTAKRFYRMSYRKGATGDFTAITTPLTDTRVSTTTLYGETYFLGPQNVNGTMALYEVRDLNHYYWYNPDWLIEWNTLAVEAKTGVYTVRLEVFDENGQPLTTVDYRNGTVHPTIPPTELPKMTNCDLVLAVQNQGPKVDLRILRVPDTGIISWAQNLTIDLEGYVAQENGRLHGWGLQYTKGLDATVHPLPVGGWFNAGIPSATLSQSISLSTLGITTSNTVAFKLWAWSHIRNGYGFVYYSEEINAIAVQKCPKMAMLATPALQTA